MPFRFYLFVLWRFMRLVVIVLISPLWVFIGGVLIAIGMAICSAENWYSNVRRDWARKQ